MKKAFLQLHLSVILAGWTGIFGKLISLSPGLIVFWRIVIAGALLWTWTRLTGKLEAVTKRDRIGIMGVGALLMIQWTLFYAAIKASNVSIGVVTFSSIGFFTALLEPLMTGSRVKLKEIAFSLLTIIGRRGETLDSIQYLASILVNKDSEDYCRLLLDSNGYREKRRKTLEQLAEKIARSVLRSGRSTTLEPMNPYERRIIHSKISEIEGVTSKSVGEDPYRKVVVSSTTGRRSGGNRGGKGGQNRGGKRPYREKKPEDFRRKNLDSMKTSFERDYKKPKPEDELNTGLYGKIEF